MYACIMYVCICLNFVFVLLCITLCTLYFVCMYIAIGTCCKDFLLVCQSLDRMVSVKISEKTIRLAYQHAAHDKGSQYHGFVVGNVDTDAGK